MKLKKLLKVWKTAWEESPRAHPLTASIDDALVKEGASTWDVLNAIAVIRSKKTNLTKEEQEFLDFHRRALAMQEISMVERTAVTTQGSIFLLKTKHGYHETSNVNQNITGQTRVVLEYGDDEPDQG